MDHQPRRTETTRVATRDDVVRAFAPAGLFLLVALLLLVIL